MIDQLRAWFRETPLGKAASHLYGRFLRAGARGTGIPWELNGAQYRIDPDYRGYIGHQYDFHLADFFKSRLKPGEVCYNVGANIGIYAMQLAHWVGPEGRVVAFEPNPGAAEVLRRHVQYNGLEDRVRVEEAAVSDAAGETSMFVTAADARSRLGAPNPDLAGLAKEVTVPVTTLDEFWESSGLDPDWMLIDIEGFEIRALLGAARVIQSRGRDLRIVVEMHPNVWDSADTTRDDAEQILERFGFQVEPLAGQTDPLGEYGHVLLTSNAEPQTVQRA